MNNISILILSLVVLFCVSAGIANEAEKNLINNGNFAEMAENAQPAGWTFGAPRAVLAPVMRIAHDETGRALLMTGGGNPDCVGWAATKVKIEMGKTYWFRVRFRKSDDLNPMQNLIFQLDDGEAINEFRQLDDGRIEGEARVSFPGSGAASTEVKIIFRLCAEGRAWIENISLAETAPVPPRWVRVACTEGPGSLEEYGLEAFGKALDKIGEAGCDLALLPEYFSGEGTTETLQGASVQLMSAKARQYNMYVAGTVGIYDSATDRLCNSALLFDRTGKMIGRYDKIHLYGPELHESGVTPGDSVKVFETDFGKVAFMTCYDSWFKDVAELAALKGAEILLFPNLGYDRGLMHARARDNRINIVTSTRSGKNGIWDTMGRDLGNLSPAPTNDEFFKDLARIEVANMGVLMATLKLAERQNIRQSGNQKVWLEEKILKEKLRWRSK